MTVGAGICVADGNLMVLGKKVLSQVHDNVLVTPASGGALLNGAFLGVSSHHKGSRTLFPIGKLEYLHYLFPNFLSFFLKNKPAFFLFASFLVFWVDATFVVACHEQ